MKKDKIDWAVEGNKERKIVREFKTNFKKTHRELHDQSKGGKS